MVRYGYIFIGVSPGIAPKLARILTPFFAQKKSAESTATPLWLLILR